MCGIVAVLSRPDRRPLPDVKAGASRLAEAAERIRGWGREGGDGDHADAAWHYDDFHHIVENINIRKLSNIPLFFNDASTFSRNPQTAMYRPLLMATHAVNYAIGFYNVVGYHVLNFAFHLVTVLAFLISKATSFPFEDEIDFVTRAVAPEMELALEWVQGAPGLQRLEQGLFQPEAGVRSGRGFCRCSDAGQFRRQAAIGPEQLGRFNQGHVGVGGDGSDARDQAAGFQQIQIAVGGGMSAALSSSTRPPDRRQPRFRPIAYRTASADSGISCN